MRPTLVFVYNADSSIFNTVTDIAHKIFSPETYSCNLCAVTYGNFGIRAEWKEYLENIDAELEFLHRDELFDHYGVANVALPAIFRKESGELLPWISAEEINGCDSIIELKKLISEKL